MTFEEVASIYGASRIRGNSVKVICPCHVDKKPSLSISRGRDGRVIFNCLGKCETADILAAKGLKFEDISGDSIPAVDRWKRYVEKQKSKQFDKPMKIEDQYDYHALSGGYAYTKLRLTDKEMTYGILKDGRWSFKLGKQRKEFKAVYSRESIKALREAVTGGERLFYAEGEKDANTLAGLGYHAVTAGGSGDWLSDLAPLFQGAEVVICGDYDSPGVELVKQVRRDLQGIATETMIIFPVTDTIGADVTDYIQDGHSVDDLEKLISQEKGKQSIYTDTYLDDLSKRLEEEKRKQSGNSEQDNKLTSEQEIDLAQFHLHDGSKVTGVYDWAIFDYLRERERIVILGGVPYIYDNGVYKADRSGSRLKTWIRELIYPRFIKSSTLKRVYDLFLSASELQVEEKDMSCYPDHWICFLNGMWDPIEGKLHPHDPSYRAMNQIPHEYDPKAVTEGREIESWLQFCFPHYDDREMILEYSGYCMTRDVSQQKFMLLNGVGGTGKSTLIKLIEFMVGSENISGMSLTALNRRFASFSLMGKLVNSCADLETAALEDTSTLKKILGEDTIEGEQKGKDSIFFKSHAKLIFSTNELPTIRNERTNGFYRRLLICTMNKIPDPDQVKTDLFRSLACDIDYFIHLSVEALSRMYKRGKIMDSSGSGEAVKQMYLDSDSVEAWLTEKMYRVKGARTEKGILFQSYSDWCSDNDRQALQRTNFYKAMRSKGFQEGRTSVERFFLGVTDVKPEVSLTVTENCHNGSQFQEVGIDDMPFD